MYSLKWLFNNIITIWILFVRENLCQQFSVVLLKLFPCTYAYVLPKWLSDKEPACQCRISCRRHGFDPRVGNIPWRRKWQPTLVFLPGESHGQRSLVGYRHGVSKELDATEWLTLSLMHKCEIYITYTPKCDNNKYINRSNTAQWL